MTRWLRWYEGTCEDAKFRLVARLSRVTVRDVIALWAFILEDAAHLGHRGVCKRNEDFMAATLDFDDGVVERILSAMEDAELISVGHGELTVCNFNKRQFESDTDPTAAERQRNKRKRDKQSRHEPVTRDSRPPDTDTDTDIPEANASGADAPDDPSIAERDYFRRGREVLGPKAGGMLAKLLKVKGANVALARSAIELAATKENPMEFAAAVCRGPPVRSPVALKDHRKQEWENARQELRQFAYGDNRGGTGGGSPVRVLPAVGRK